MRLLVTGASGFVGTHVVAAAIAAGHDVIVTTRSLRGYAEGFGTREDVRVIEADLADGRVMRAIGRETMPDVALHLAWSIGRDVHDSPENLTSAAGSLELARGLVEAGCRRIAFVGTHVELAASDEDLREDAEPHPRNVYGSSKDAVRRLVTALVSGTGSRFVWARLFNLYGPGAQDWSLVAYVIRRLLDGEACPMTHGEQQRTFMHVSDAARALIATACSDVTGIVHVGSDEVVTVRELAERIAARVGNASSLVFGARDVSSRDAMRIVPSTERLRHEVGFEEARCLDDGLADTIARIRADSTREVSR